MSKKQYDYGSLEVAEPTTKYNYGTLETRPSNAPDARTATQVAIDQMDAINRGYLQPVANLPDTLLSILSMPFETPGERSKKVVEAVKSYAQPAVTSVKGAISGKKIQLPGMGGTIQFPDFEEGNPSSPVWTAAAEGAGSNMTNSLATVGAVKALQKVVPRTYLDSNYEIQTTPGALDVLKQVAANPAARAAVERALKIGGTFAGGSIFWEFLRRLRENR